MDGYRDLHLALSSGHYASARYPSGYGVERRGSYAGGDPLYSVYPRGVLDAYGAYGSTAAYQPSEYPYFVSPRRRANPNPKRRPPPQSSGKKRPATAQMLTPKKKPLKKTQKGLQLAKVKPARKVQEVAGTPKKAAGGSILARETEDLHKLFRTGVDSGIKIVNPKGASGASGKTASANGAGKKRKADAKKGSPLTKKDKFKKKKFAKAKKQEGKVAEKLAEEAKVPLTEEEEKEIELDLDLQRTACKAFADVFWIPVKTAVPELEPEKDSAMADGADVKADTTGDEKTLAEALKPSPKLKLTPEMFKEIEEKALNFFSNILAENNELSKLYMSKKDAGTFECLVCHSTKPETSKRFSNVAALVSHTIMRRQRRPEHRGFGKAICHIFGWEDFKPKRPIKQAVLDGEKLEEVEVEKVEEKRERNLQAVLEQVVVGKVEEEDEGTEAEEEK